MTKTRIEALTDGIFATVMTVLVLGLSLPAGLLERDLEIGIVNLSPHILAYVFSFVVLGVYWIGHHNQFHYIKRTDRVFLWINILFLLTIGFVPFSTSLLGEYPFSQTAVRIYGANPHSNRAGTLWHMVACNYQPSSRRQRPRPSHRESGQTADHYCFSFHSLFGLVTLTFISEEDLTTSLQAVATSQHLAVA